MRCLRKPIIASAMFVMSACAAWTASAVPDPVAGDINSDGHVDAVDVQLVINGALSIPVAFDTNVDFDAAGLTTAIDVQLVINAALGVIIDSDGDGLANIAEANLGTNPDVKDTDGGGVNDGVEVLIDHSNPLLAGDDAVSVSVPVPPTADFTGAPTTGSYPLDVQFTDTSTNGTSPINQWLWNFGDGNTSVAPNPSHTYIAQGTYSVALTVHSAAGQDSMIKTNYITVTQPAQPQNHWVSLLDGYWDDQNNWSLGHVPTVSELAVVDMPAQNITVTVRNYTTIYNAQITENLTIASGASLNESGQATIDGTFTIAGGTLQVNGAGATFTANGAVQLQNHRVSVQNGGIASFPTLTTFTYNAIANPTIFDVSGTGSVLDLSHVTSFTFNDGVSSNITATISAASSGHIDLSALTNVTLGANHHFKFDVSSGGTISADLLQTNSGLAVNTATGGALNLPGLTSLSNVSVTGTGTLTVPNATSADQLYVSLSGGSLAADLLASITNSNGAITLYGTAAMTLPNLTTLTNSSVTLQNTASLTLPALLSMSSTTGNTVSVSGGATLALDQLTNLTNIYLSATSAGQLVLPALTTYLWNYNMNPYAITADGAGTLLNLPALTNFTFNDGLTSNITLSLHASNTAAITLPALQDVTLGVNHSYGLVLQSGGTITANLLRTNAGLSISLGSGSVLTLPGLTSLSNSFITSAGTLTVPNVISGNFTWFSITGGALIANGLTSLTSANTTFDVNGTAVVSLPSLTTLTDTSIRVQNSATLSLPGLTTISSITSNSLTVSNTATLALDNLTSLTNINLVVNNAGQLTLPALTTYLWNYNVNPYAITVDGAGSQLNLPVLANLTFNAGVSSNITLTLQASNSGAMTLPALQDVTLGTNHSYGLSVQNGGTISANLLRTNAGLRITLGSASSLTLPGLTSLSNAFVTSAGTLTVPNVTSSNFTWYSITGGSFVANSLSSITSANTTFDVNGTAVVTLPNVTTLTDTSLRLQNSATLSLPALTAISSAANNTLTASNSATLALDQVTSLTNMYLVANSAGHLALPALTTYLWSYNMNPTAITVDGAGSTLNLPVLTNLTFNAGVSSNITLTLQASNSGAMTLPALTGVTLGTNHKYQLYATSGGTISDDNLAASSGLVLLTASGSTLTLPGLTSLTNTTINGTGNVVMANAITGAGCSFYITGGSITAANLASLTDTTVDIEGTASLSLPTLTSLTSTTSNFLYMWSSGSFSTPALSSLTNIKLSVRNGAHLSLPITSYVWNQNVSPKIFDVSGAGTQLTLTSLTHLTYDAGVVSNITCSIQAASGSQIDASALNTVTLGTNHLVTINADGAGSQIAITALNPLPANVTATATNGGALL